MEDYATSTEADVTCQYQHHQLTEKKGAKARSEVTKTKRPENTAYRSSQARVRAVVAAVDDGGVEASEELKVATARPRLHHVEPVLDAKLGNGTTHKCTRITREVSRHTSSSYCGGGVI